MVEASGNPKTPQFATGALSAPKANIANNSVTYGWSGRGDLNGRPPRAQDQFLLHSRNFDSKTTGKTQWEFLMEVPAAKSARSFQGRRPRARPCCFGRGLGPSIVHRF